MAAVTRVKARPVLIPGYEVNDDGQAKVALVAGDGLVIVADTPTRSGFNRVYDKAPTTATEHHAIALMDAKAGGKVEAGIHGEIDGFSGLTPGVPIYPSGTVAGGLDTTAPAGAVIRMRAVSATRIRYTLV